MGYALFYESKEFKKIVQEKRKKEIVLKQSLRPQLVESMASQRLTLQPIQAKQIIHLTQSETIRVQ